MAKNLKSRLNSYQTSDPGRNYKVEHYEERADFRELEKHIHRKFENAHEWVKADLKDIVSEMRTFEGVLTV